MAHHQSVYQLEEEPLKPKHTGPVIFTGPLFTERRCGKLTTTTTTESGIFRALRAEQIKIQEMQQEIPPQVKRLFDLLDITAKVLAVIACIAYTQGLIHQLQFYLFYFTETPLHGHLGCYFNDSDGPVTDWICSSFPNPPQTYFEFTGIAIYLIGYFSSIALFALIVVLGLKLRKEVVLFRKSILSALTFYLGQHNETQQQVSQVGLWARVKELLSAIGQILEEKEEPSPTTSFRADIEELSLALSVSTRIIVIITIVPPIVAFVYFSLGPIIALCGLLVIVIVLAYLDLWARATKEIATVQGPSSTNSSLADTEEVSSPLSA